MPHYYLRERESPKAILGQASDLRLCVGYTSLWRFGNFPDALMHKYAPREAFARAPEGGSAQPWQPRPQLPETSKKPAQKQQKAPPA